MSQINKILTSNNTLKGRLLDFPGAIRAKKSEHETARLALKDAQIAVRNLEAEMAVAISAEVNPDTGKARFTNAAMREAELVRRKAEDANYGAMAKFVRQMEETLSAAQFDLERLYDEFRAVRYVVDLTARELAVIAVDWQSDSRPGKTSNRDWGEREPQPY